MNGARRSPLDSRLRGNDGVGLWDGGGGAVIYGYGIVVLFAGATLVVATPRGAWAISPILDDSRRVP